MSLILFTLGRLCACWQKPMVSLYVVLNWFVICGVCIYLVNLFLQVTCELPEDSLWLYWCVCWQGYFPWVGYRLEHSGILRDTSFTVRVWVRGRECHTEVCISLTYSSPDIAILALLDQMCVIWHMSLIQLCQFDKWYSFGRSLAINLFHKYSRYDSI